MNTPKQGEDTTVVLFACAMIAVLFVLPAWYAAHMSGVNGAFLHLAKAQLWPFAALSDEAREALVRIARTPAASVPWETVLKVLEYSGSWIRWPYLAILAALGTVGVVLGRVGGLTRRFNMDTLLLHNEKSFPCLHPIVGRGTYLLDRESHDRGLWRIARTPAQFALEHGLLLHEQDGEPLGAQDALVDGLPVVPSRAWGHALLDTQKAGQVFRAQLGREYAGFEALALPRKVLGSALLAYAAGAKSDCMALLDAAALSYVERDGTAQCPIFAQASFQQQVGATWQQHKKLLDSSPLLQRHCAFEVPLFMALLHLARRKGVLACSQFLWLRPIDRPLWYALNQCGGRVAWVEALAPWAHYAVEEEKGASVSGTGATEALCLKRLKDTLDEQGWLGVEGEIFGCAAAGNCIAALKDTPEDTLDVRQELVKEGLGGEGLGGEAEK